ncbi:MAG: thioredoxin-disulfide reductase [Eubacteriales bacterium]|nr:thioredoxin-disulfide reductase [Eubacteriales bacterium]
MDKSYDVIIIGGGPAGFTAAIYSARAMLKTLLIEKFFSGGQMATAGMIDNYPGFDEPVGGAELAEKMEKQAIRFGAEIIRDEVVEVDLENEIKTVKTGKGKYAGKTVIICTGAIPRELGLKNETEFRGAGVSYCATCDGAFFKGMTVAVAGGGDTAAKDAIYLSRICKKVYVIHRRDSLRASKWLQDSMFKIQNIEIIWDSVVENINGKFGVESLDIRNVKTNDLHGLKTDGLFVAIGSIPDTAVFKDKIKLNENGYIITDDKMQTGISGVYAAGDVREKNLRQIVTAAADGAIASYMAESHLG